MPSNTVGKSKFEGIKYLCRKENDNDLVLDSGNCSGGGLCGTAGVYEQTETADADAAQITVFPGEIVYGEDLRSLQLEK